MEDYIVTNGTFYFGKDKHGNLIRSITDIKKAEKMPYEKAIRVLKNSIPSSDTTHWQVSLFETKGYAQKTNLSLVKTLPSAHVEQSKDFDLDWNDFISSLKELSDCIYNYKGVFSS
jgi:hypothetical protein